MAKRATTLCATLIAALLAACNAPGVAGTPPTVDPATPDATAADPATTAATPISTEAPAMAATEPADPNLSDLPQGWGEHVHASSGLRIGVPAGWTATDTGSGVELREDGGDGWADLIAPGADATPGIAIALDGAGDPAAVLGNALDALQQNGEFGAVQPADAAGVDAATVEGYYEPFAERLFIGVIAVEGGQAVLIGHGVESSEPDADWDYLSAVYQQMLLTVKQGES